MENLREKKERSLVVGLIALIVIIVVLALIGLFLLKPEPQIIQGQAEATQVRVSGKLPGRVVEFMVEEGQHVLAGDTLVHIHSSLVEAKLSQAEAMETVAKAQNKKVDSGTRVELLNSAYDMWQQAQAGLTIAKKTYERMQSLYKKGVVSEQKRDEAEAAYKAMAATESAAKSQYEMAKAGAQAEDKAAAAAMVAAAQGSVAEVESILSDSYLTAPTDGEISDIFPNVGELVSLGAPIMNVLKLDDMWVSFNVREDLLENLTMGAEVQAIIPALENKEVTLKVFYIRDMGSYAVWRATKVTGQYDAKTFQVKARPVEPVDNLRPGMSVLLKRDKK
ncbi:HlyD family secretion protein [Barnesiella intestinihominis]|uniref:HlyD family secretion protein n=1 Tax=Barnesiella intestinihominis TaxID=487174 RepID=UPI002673F162|nr:efflux RND transporter periplasmic adaptor subunit [Barnesiella intestinihominis]